MKANKSEDSPLGLVKDENLLQMGSITPQQNIERYKLNHLYVSHSDKTWNGFTERTNKIALTICFTDVDKNYFTSNFTLKIKNLPYSENPPQFNGFKPSEDLLSLSCLQQHSFPESPSDRFDQTI